MPKFLYRFGFCLLLMLGLEVSGWSQAPSPASATYCNPMNLDYGYTPIPNFAQQGHHRATADPVITSFQGKYYLFSTNQWGYWWSKDLLNWTFVARKFLLSRHPVYDELCAPATLVLGDSLLVIGSTYTNDFPLWLSKNPTQADSWTIAVDSFLGTAWDPAFFVDDDGRVYLYHGSSNTFPLYGVEINRKTLQPIRARQELIRLQDSLHGWERFGEYADNTFLKPFMEGAWVNKYQGKYYLQYGAPGTEFSGYGDGVYTSEAPLGPWTYQDHNPFSYKPGGFARGAGHGATFQDNYGNWWHVSTISISVKNNFERRLGLWPAGFDPSGLLYCNTAYGDYPHFLPTGGRDHQRSTFTGWMLLNHQKPVRVSSTLGALAPNFAVDERIQTYWSAQTGRPGEWLSSDLGQTSQVYAIQVNYADQDADVLGKPTGHYHQYKIYGSEDGKKWQLWIDKSRNQTEVPHDYVVLPSPRSACYVKIENIHLPTGKFALSGLRVFGRAEQTPPPPAIAHFNVLRGDSERRNAWLKWMAEPTAVGYVIYSGIAPDKLYTSIMVYSGQSEYYFTAMDRDRGYYFQIEAFNEGGIGPRSEVVQVK